MQGSGAEGRRSARKKVQARESRAAERPAARASTPKHSVRAPHTTSHGDPGERIRGHDVVRDEEVVLANDLSAGQALHLPKVFAVVSCHLRSRPSSVVTTTSALPPAAPRTGIRALVGLRCAARAGAHPHWRADAPQRGRKGWREIPLRGSHRSRTRPAASASRAKI